MARERFKEGKRGSFFGDFVYEQVVPKDHFLVKLNEVVPWQRFTYKLVKYYRGRAKEGRPPYDPAVLLKMLLVSYLYDISERQTEEVANLNLAVKYFLGLAVNEAPPDHSTLTAFKRRIIENGKVEALEKVLREIIGLAQEQGIRFGGLQIVDSVHTVADVNVAKEDARQKEGKSAGEGWRRKGIEQAHVLLWVQEPREYQWGDGVDHQCGGDPGQCAGWAPDAQAGGGRPGAGYAGGDSGCRPGL